MTSNLSNTIIGPQVSDEAKEPMVTTRGPRTLRDNLFELSSRLLGREGAKFLFKVYGLTRFDIFGKPRGAIGSIEDKKLVLRELIMSLRRGLGKGALG